MIKTRPKLQHLQTAQGLCRPVLWVGLSCSLESSTGQLFPIDVQWPVTTQYTGEEGKFWPGQSPGLCRGGEWEEDVSQANVQHLSCSPCMRLWRPLSSSLSSRLLQLYHRAFIPTVDRLYNTGQIHAKKVILRQYSIMYSTIFYIIQISFTLHVPDFCISSSFGILVPLVKVFISPFFVYFVFNILITGHFSFLCCNRRISLVCD